MEKYQLFTTALLIISYLMFTLHNPISPVPLSDYTPIGVEPHGPTRGVWPIATVANDSQLHLVTSSI